MDRLKALAFEIDIQERELTSLDGIHGPRVTQAAEMHAKDVSSSFIHDVSAQKQLEDLQKQISSEQKAAESLRRHVQRISRNRIIEKYGAGPHRVEFTIDFGDDDTSTFIAEMAPIDSRPHSVQVFLDMVQAKLWDSTWLFARENAMIKASYGPTEAGAIRKNAFQDAGLDSLALEETDNTYNHNEYTLGFLSSEKPVWFINTVDDSEPNHASPCFAKVVEGIETIRRIESVPIYNGSHLETMIEVKKVRIL
jgi:cyclophilin family peptidyl-prolyl cis-trans isomerase